MNTEIAFRIRKLREFRNYTQTYMATQLSMSQNTYSKVENGITAIKTDILEKIAKILNVPAEQILNGDMHIFNLSSNTAGKENTNQQKYIIGLMQDEIDYLREQNKLLITTLGYNAASQPGRPSIQARQK